MSEFLSRLDRLRIVREWQAYQLGRTDRTIAELERQEAAAVRKARSLSPPEPSWKLGMHRGGGQPTPEAVHTGDCGMAGKRTRPMTCEQALHAITKDGIPPCPYCRPDTHLGVL